jgi:signal transduction histidine kinase
MRASLLRRYRLVGWLVVWGGLVGGELRAQPSPTTAARAAINRAYALGQADSLPAALKVLRQAAATAHTAGRTVDEAWLRNFLAGELVEMADLSGADLEATEAVRVARRAGHPQTLGTSYYHLASSAFEQQELPRAIGLLRQAVTYFARYDSVSAQYVSALSMLGNAYFETGHYRAARPYLRRALVRARQRKDPLAAFTVLSSWGNGLRETAPDTARHLMEQALQLAQTGLRDDGTEQQAETYARLVLMQIDQRQAHWDAVLAGSRRVVAGARELRNAEFEAEALTAMAAALRHLGQAAAAYDTLTRATALTDTLRSRAKNEELARQQARLGDVEKQARIRELEQSRRLSRLRADQQQARARRLALTAMALAVGLVIVGLLLGLVVRQRRRLVASEAALRAADATKDRLMSIIGHDLRGPVATFQQAMPLMQYYARHPDPAEQLALADDLARRAQQFGALLDNLLYWSYSQRNEVRNRPEAMSATAAMLAAATLYQSGAAVKGVTLRVAADPAVADVWVDPVLLATVLRNLTSNALKFTSAGGTVTLGAEPLPGRGVRFRVTDTGVGMTAAQVARLFDTASADRSTTGTAGEDGTGLGLLVCHHFVRLLGGALTVTSRVGEGTEFSFETPLVPTA